MIASMQTGVTNYTTPNEREVVIERWVAAPRTLVFAAWTDPQHIPQWLTGPEGWSMPICEVDLRPGGAWRYVYRNVSGAEMILSGTIVEVTPPSRMVSTESWGPEWPETVNTLELSESNAQTLIVLTISYVSREARDAALQSGMKDGVDLSFARLDAWLEART